MVLSARIGNEETLSDAGFIFKVELVGLTWALKERRGFRMDPKFPVVFPSLKNHKQSPFFLSWKQQWRRYE